VPTASSPEWRRVLPSGEVIVPAVGGFNTVFSLALYSGFVLLFGHLLPHSGKPLIVDFAFAISTPLSITVAFLCYKTLRLPHPRQLPQKSGSAASPSTASASPWVSRILPTATHLFLSLAVTHRYAPFLAGIVNSITIAC